MHYYKRNLGDYAKKAGRLSMLQHGSYTLLIDACYDREQFPTLDEAIEWTWASTTEEVEAVTFVLRKFFTLEDGRYVQKRIQEEITDYHQKAETNKRIAQDREAKRNASSTDREQIVDGSPPNHKPITKNQEPRTKEIQGKPARASRKSSADADCVSFDDLIAEGVHPQHAMDWLKSRKDKGAKTLTKTAWQAVKDEAFKAGLPIPDAVRLSAANNWQGFKASWLDKPAAHGPQQHQPAPLSPLGQANLQNMQNLKQKLLAREQAEQASKGHTHEHEPV
jgi:uncharacterized protein YdaU (DUF1376 family)